MRYIVWFLILVSAVAGFELDAGLTSQKVPFVAVDATDMVTREPGLVAGFTATYSINGGAWTGMTTPTTAENGGTGSYWLSVDEAGMTTLTAGHDVGNLYIEIAHASIWTVSLNCEVRRAKLTAGQTVAASDSKVDGVKLADTLTTYTNNTVQSGNAYPAATAAQTAAEKIDTNTELRTLLFGSDTAGATATALATAQTDLDLYDTDAEHAAANWGADATTYQAQGTFGQAIGDPVLDTSTLWGLVNSYLDEAISGLDDNAWDDAARSLTALDEDDTTIDLTAAINAEVLDVLNVDTWAEPAPGAPPTAPTLAQAMRYMYALHFHARNTTASEDTIRNYANAADLFDTPLADDGTTFTRDTYTAP